MCRFPQHDKLKARKDELTELQRVLELLRDSGFTINHNRFSAPFGLRCPGDFTAIRDLVFEVDSGALFHERERMAEEASAKYLGIPTPPLPDQAAPQRDELDSEGPSA